MSGVTVQQIRKKVSQSLLEKGYQIPSSLPVLDIYSLREIRDIRGRMAIMLALIYLSFGNSPVHIKKWIEDKDLSQFLSEKERSTLYDKDSQSEDIVTFRWYLQSLWALMWATSMVGNLSEDRDVEDYMASLLPDIKNNEDTGKLNRLELRSVDELYTILDRYYCLHWYCVNERLQGNSTSINEGLVYHRRKALEWILYNNEDWDMVRLDT
ncbi:DUF4272 domain-containing protein [Spirosoma fluminis]